MIKKLIVLSLLILPLIISAANYSFTWNEVTATVDGQALTDVGYKFHCGTQPGVYTIEHDNGTSAKLEDVSFLPTDGKWYCAVSAYKAGFTPSGKSEEINFFMIAGHPSKGVLAVPGGLKIEVF